MATKQQKQTQQAYQIVLATPAGRDVLDDLTVFAQASDITEARALGRADVVLRMMREKKRSYDLEQETE